MIRATILAASVLFGSVSLLDVDLAAKYKPVLDFSEEAGGQGWTSAPEDVWSLSSLTY